MANTNTQVKFMIMGRRYFKSGNTYHSVRVFDHTGTCLTHIPYEYGYDDAYIETGLEWLEKNGHIVREEKPNGGRTFVKGFPRENGIFSFVTDVSRKKDL